MNKQIAMVAEFHRAFGHPVMHHMTMPLPERIRFRQRILQEELNELTAALENKDITEVADAITDCMYILIGTAHECGLGRHLEACFAEVQRSNMSKLDRNGKPIYREDGKVLKSDLYSPPYLASILIPGEWVAECDPYLPTR